MLSTRIRGQIMQTRNKQQKINMRVTTSQYEQAAKIMHICSVIIYPLQKKFIGTSSSLARGKSSVLLTDSLVTHCICQVVTRTRPPICLSFDFNLQCPLLVPHLSSTTQSNAPMTSAIALSKSSVRIGI